MTRVGPGHRRRQPRPGRAGARPATSWASWPRRSTAWPRSCATTASRSTARLLRAQRTSQATIDSFPDPVLVSTRTAASRWPTRPPGELLGVARAAADEAGSAGRPGSRPSRCAQPLAEALRGPAATICPTGSTRSSRSPSAARTGAFLPQILPIRDPYGDTLGAAVVLNDVTRFRLLDQSRADLSPPSATS